MLLIEHSAFHLYREDAYREYAISVDVWGAYQPCSFIYLCFQSFKELCVNQGLLLAAKPKVIERDSTVPAERFQGDAPLWTREPRGLVSRLCDENDVQRIRAATASGRNVLALIPSAAIEIYNHVQGHEPDLPNARRAADMLGLSDSERRVVPRMHPGQVWWEELASPGSGRLFICEDSAISEGSFREDYGRSEKNLEELNKLVVEFATFKVPVFGGYSMPCPNVWPCHEALTTSINVRNHGPAIDFADVVVQMPNSCEPTSPLELRLHRLLSLSEMTIAVQYIPHVAGLLQPLKISLGLPDGSSARLDMDEISIQICPPLANSIREQARQDDVSLSMLEKLGTGFVTQAEFVKLRKLLKADAGACLNKIRSISEQLASQLIAKARLQRQEKFVDAIKLLQERQILSNRAIAYLHTIRTIGNFASHTSGMDLTEQDVRIAAYCLASVLEDVLSRKAV